MTAEPTTRVLKPGTETMTAAARCLAAGGLVAFPTETVYGLGADATNGEAVARLYAAKGRPAFNPLISHVPDVDAARRLGRFDPAAARLAEAFWPGPLTLVLPQHGRLPGRRACDRGARYHRACGFPIMRWRAISWRPSAGRSSRRRRTAPATSRRRRRSMCSPICAAAST